MRLDIAQLTGPLDRLLARMGAPLREHDWPDEYLPPPEIDPIELERGIDIELEDVETNTGGLLAYKGYQVMLYIPDQGWSLNQVLTDPARGKKFHVAHCATLEAMKHKGRFERYVVRNGLSKLFTVTGEGPDGKQVTDAQAELRVCRNCLKKLNYQNFRYVRRPQQTAIVEDFSQENFFSTYSSYFRYMPSRSASQIELNAYTPDWKEVSRNYRESVRWTCESCQVNLHRNPGLLHTHHVNGNCNDNSPGNLKALCSDCHSKEPMHETLFVRREDRHKIQQLRKDQKLYKPKDKPSRSTASWDTAFKYADPAVHGLLHALREHYHEAPIVGYDVADTSGRVVYSNAELAWPREKELVVLDGGGDARGLEVLGWTVWSVQEMLNDLA